MKTKIFKICFFCGFFAGLAFFCLPGQVRAGVELEVEFPKFSGQEGITGSSPLSAVIKYALNVIVVAIALAVVFSLIYGGVLYLTSAGNSGQMALAKKRITASALGLLIVVSSFLLLRLINTQLLFLKIKKELVVSGVVLLNQAAYNMYGPGVPNNVLANPNSAEAQIEEALQALLDAPGTDLNEPKAVFLGGEMSDLTKRFGDLKVGGFRATLFTMFEESLKYYDVRLTNEYPAGTGNFNFENFKLAAVYFLPGTDARLLTYHNAGFLSDKVGLGSGKDFRPPDFEYRAEECSIGNGPCRFKLLDEGFDADFTVSIVEEFLYENVFKNLSSDKLRTAPLAMKIERTGPGVYLSSVDSDGRKVKELFLQNKEQKPRLIDWMANKDVNHIEIRNSVQQKQANDTYQLEKTANFLTILHEDEDFRGALQLFFENGFSIALPNGMSRSFPLGNLPRDNLLTPENEAQADIINKATLYGRVDKPSSVQVFQIAEETTGCEVLVCAQIGLHDCYAYLLNHNTEPSAEAKDAAQNTLWEWRGINTGIADFPLLTPKLLPATVTAIEEGVSIEVPLIRNIESMRIFGDCLVALFENEPGNDPAGCLAGSTNLNGCWQNGSPGGLSEVFSPWSKEHQDNLGYLDLTEDNKAYTHTIGRCGCIQREIFDRFIALDDCRSCASAISIIPIKP